MAKTSEQKKSVAAERLVDIGNIVGLAEIAQRTGSTPHAVWNWTKRYEFPKPIATVSGRPVYDWSEVEEWNNNWERSKGGFHTHKARREGEKDVRPAGRTKAAAKPTKAAAKPAPAKRAKPSTAAKKAEPVATVTPIRRARRARPTAS